MAESLQADDTYQVEEVCVFMEPKGSSLCSQKPANGSCHKCDKSSSQVHTIFPYDSF